MAKQTPHHRLRVLGRLGALPLDADLRLCANWTMLYGPSGSGKSTLLRAACGLLPPTISVDFTRQNDKDDPEVWKSLQTPRECTPPHLRDLGYAPQNAALFPHLSVHDNIAFSLKNQPQTIDKEGSIADALSLFYLSALADRRPRDLSGGERQRVNLARAYVRPHCKLMLLDEPFAGIDRTLRDEILPELLTALFRRGIPVLSVSHDVEEAFLLQCEIVKVRDGKIEDQGHVSEVLAAERERTLDNLSR